MADFKFVMSSPKADRLNLRTTKLLQVEYGNIVNICIPGNTNLECGDVIKLSIPDQSGEDDRFLSGNYIITSIRHIIENRYLTTSLRLSKDSYVNNHETEIDFQIARIPLER